MQFNNKRNTNFYTPILTHAAAAVSDSTTYYIGASWSRTPTTGSIDVYNYLVPIAGTITAAYLNINVNGTLGTDENSTFSLVVNDTDFYEISSAVKHNAKTGLYSLESQNIPVVAGDKLKIKWTTPAWVTNPTTVINLVTVIIDTLS